MTEVCCPRCQRVAHRDAYLPRFEIDPSGGMSISGVDVSYRCTGTQCGYVFHERAAMLSEPVPLETAGHPD
jgi:hypothetical protein